MTELRRLGATDLHILPLVLGGNVFGWTADRTASFAVLDAFVDGGGTMIDTADVYSRWVPGHTGGESETIIGEWLKTSGRRDKVLIATKVGMAPAESGSPLSREAIIAGCEGSLKRLGVETIDLYYAHKDDADAPLDVVAEAFASLVKAGKVRALGASNYHAMRLKAAVDAARAAGVPHFQVLQPEYNLVNRHHFEGQLQDYCVEHNIGVVPYYGLASGFLTGKYRTADDMKQSVRGGGMAELIEQKAGVLAVMDAVAAETGGSLAQIALAWLAAQPGVTAPIASATRRGSEGFPVKRLAFYGAVEPLEGTAPDGVVVLEFPSVEDARAWYHGPGYQAAMQHRLKAADYRVMIVEGV